MPVIHKSTIKAARQAEKRRLRNRTLIRALNTIQKKVVAAVGEKNVDAAKTSLKEATSALSKAVTKGLLKPNTASRRVSRLTLKVNSIASSQT